MQCLALKIEKSNIKGIKRGFYVHPQVNKREIQELDLQVMVAVGGDYDDFYCQSPTRVPFRTEFRVEHNDNFRSEIRRLVS